MKVQREGRGGREKGCIKRAGEDKGKKGRVEKEGRVGKRVKNDGLWEPEEEKSRIGNRKEEGEEQEMIREGKITEEEKRGNYRRGQGSKER